MRPITANQYLYANGNPLIYIDPDGRQSIEGLAYAYGSGRKDDVEEAMRGLANQSPMVGRSVGVAIGVNKMVSAPVGLAQDAASAVQGDGAAVARMSALGDGLAARSRKNLSTFARYGVAGLAVDAVTEFAEGVATDIESIRAEGARHNYIGQGEVGLNLIVDATAVATGAGGVMHISVALARQSTARVAISEGRAAAAVVKVADARQAVVAGGGQGGSTYRGRLNQTPVNGGWWDGSRGESTFYSRDPTVQSITRDRGVTYSDARPDFSPYSAAEVEIANMTANRCANFMQADQETAQGMGVPRREVTETLVAALPQPPTALYLPDAQHSNVQVFPADDEALQAFFEDG